MDATTGNVSEEAWGVTLASFAMRRATGELSIGPADKEIKVAFKNGAVIGAQSSSLQDSAVRVAVQLSLVTTSQVSDIARRHKLDPSRDEVDVIAEVAKLQPDQMRRLRRRTVALRAARTFAITSGGYKFINAITIPITPGNELDTRAVIYIGARVHLPAERISDDLKRLEWTLTPLQIEELPQFGFGAAEMTIIEGLRGGMSVDELVASNPEIDARMAQAVLYTLVACNAPDRMPVVRMSSPAIAIPGMEEFAERVDSKELIGGSNALFRSKPTSVPPIRPTPTPRPGGTTAPPRTLTPQPPRTLTPRPGSTSPPMRPTPSPTGSNPLIRTGSQPRMARPTATPAPSASQSQPGVAVTVGTDEARKEAEEAFKRGEMALRRENFKEAMAEFVRAVELSPGNGAYLGALAWTKFCTAEDKESVASEVKTALARAIFATETAGPRFYLGRVERMLGRDREALGHFQSLLMEFPQHAEAKSEARILEARLSDRPKRPTSR